MADDVDVEAERAANAARAAVKRTRRSSANLVPLLLVVFAILTVAVLLMTDKQSPQTTPRVEGPATTQPAN